MNRRQKIIVSVTGIFLVLLLLVGLTYAYFLTRITGNTNDKSISVSTANLAIVYGNDDGSVIGEGEKITPGTTFEPKTFTVTNQGNANTDYVVVIEDVNVTYAETIEVDGTTQTAGTETTFESNDFTYTLTCTSGCNSVQEPTTFPIEGGILIGNRIDVNETQTYSFTLTYKETGENQSNDMNKKLEAKINIKDITTINPYSDKPNTLAYNIINNAVALTNEEKLLGYAELVGTPYTKVVQEISAENESVLSVAQDEYGTSYYYRGAVKNNYLEFNNMCWRIVRIEGDGAIKITLAAQKKCSEITNEDTGSAFIGTGDYGYTNDGMADYENGNNRTSSMKYKFNIFLYGGSFTIKDKTITYMGLTEENIDLLKSEEVCIGDTKSAYTIAGVLMTEAEKQMAIMNNDFIGYKNFVRIYTDEVATLMCDTTANKTAATKIFPLTADEVIFAGGKLESANYSYYLIENATSDYWWTLSSSFFDGIYDSAFNVYDYGYMNANDYVDVDYSLRPAVSLKSERTLISGNGTQTNPYIIQ